MNISYCYGLSKTDAYPVMFTAPTFDAFINQIRAFPRAHTKGRAYICSPLRRNGIAALHRCAKDVLPRSWLGHDLDGGSREEIDVLLMRLSSYRAIAWRTASSTPEHPRWRIIVFLDREIDRAEGVRLGAALVGVLGEGLSSLKWDKSTHLGEQPCFLPLAGTEIMEYFGSPVAVDSVLAKAPEEEPRAARPETTDPYRALIVAKGLLLRESGAGEDEITCPFNEEHSEKTSDSSTVYWHPLHRGYRWGRIHCLHTSHCKDRPQEEFIRKLGGDPREVWREQAREEFPLGGYEEDAPRVRPVIDVRAGYLYGIAQDALDVLKDAGTPIYLRGDTLYRPVRIKDPPKDDDHTRRPVGALVLRMIDSVWTRLQLSHVATWQKWDARGKGRLADPPKDIAETVASQSDIGDWPVLRAVASHPVITQRGRVISDPGYDPASGLLLEITGDWPIPDAPTRDDAIAAWERLKNLLRYFPWTCDVDRAVAISMLMTAIARPSLPGAPMHGFDAPEAGTGKSLLIDVASILASGTEAPVMDYGRDAIEAGKRLDAMLVAGDPLIAIDNVEAPIEGATLCQTLTQTTRRIRILGLSKVVTVPCMAMLTVTGNNLLLRGDVVRRVLVGRLDAQTERPESRDFDQDIIAEASEYRRHLVADILSIMLAYQRAGCPDGEVTRFGSYEPWSRMVRQALVWVGEVDPCLSLERTRGADPSRQELGAVLEAWHAAFGKDPVTAAQAVKEAWEGSDLRVALAAVCEKRGVLDTRVLGNWLRAHRDRRSGRLVLRSGPPDAHSKVAQWVVSAG